MGFGSTVQGCRREVATLGRWVLTEFQIYYTHTPIYYYNCMVSILSCLHLQSNLDTMSFYITKSSEERIILYAPVTVK